MVNFDNTFDDLCLYIQEKGFYFSKEELFNLYISLISKPFLIISGISGTGKSKIIDLIADYISKSNDHYKNCELISVKPNWIDSSDIFGYHNILNNTYHLTPTIKLFIKAISNPDKPYFIILDEMNLARVEHYFSDFLSVLESRKIEKYNFDYNKIMSLNKKNLTLSETIILSSLSLGYNKFRSVSHYRETEIVEQWLDSSTGENSLAQFRTELNQGRDKIDGSELMSDGTRLAGKAFLSESKGDSYKLKDFTKMDNKIKETATKLFNWLELTADKTITQSKITLHNNPLPIRSNINMNEFDKSLIEEDGYFVPPEIEIPLNLFIIGTVNIDETTNNFSNKVLDRANVLEFNRVDLLGAYGIESLNDEVTDLIVDSFPLDFKISLANTRDTMKFNMLFRKEFEILIEIFELLKNYNKHFGYRVFNEISLYVLNFVSKYKLNDGSLIALDLQVLQKVLPKLNGSDSELGELLISLEELLSQHELKKSAEKVSKMNSILINQGFVTFIE